jgi:21S rRNA (uridine2791-2'-O)-methyltransferase
MTEDEVDEMEKGYIDIERHAHLEGVDAEAIGQVDTDRDQKRKEDAEAAEAKLPLKQRDKRKGRVVDVVLSDMSEPWDQVTGFHKKSLSDPYFRLMNTSGIAFKDHAGSMVSCTGRVIIGRVAEISAGPVHGGSYIFLRHSSDGRTLPLQILPGS